MQFTPYTIQTVDEVIRELNADPTRGLSIAEAANRKRGAGKNELYKKQVTGWHIFLRQLKSPFIYLLIGAAILDAGLKEFTDCAFILIFIIINTAFGFYQEYHSEKTATLLARLVTRRARVMRNGEEKIIPSTDVVPGDLVMVQTGDMFPADMRIIEAEGLTVDESMLSGESVPIAKNTDPLDKPAEQFFEATNIGFSGTAVASGTAHGIVCATGNNTAIGNISKLTEETNRESSFQKGLSTFSSFILRMVAVTLIFIVGANALIKGTHLDISEFMIFAIALAISVIPEALPVVTTFSLSRGAMHLAKRKVIVKRLSAIEDLGGVEVLCTDKTGTITENKLTVADVYVAANENPITWASLAAPFLKEKEAEPNNAFDMALWEKLNESERGHLRAFTLIDEIPFDPEQKCNSVLVKNNAYELISRGAIEVILERCTKMTEQNRTRVRTWCSVEGKKGHRVIAVAKKTRAHKSLIKTNERGMTFVGCISFTDPLKSSTIDAVKQARALNIHLKILTGDAPEVAGAVGYQIGLIKSPEQVMTGSLFDNLSHNEKEQAVKNHAVFARVSPQQKYSIVKLLQTHAEVGFLGEGINDAPALKAANVALVVDSASDIAREAADIILLKKSLSTIIEGIAEGRMVFANTIKYIKATLASNFGNFYAVAIASLMVDFLPMLPIQILLVNLLSDFPMIAIATDTVDHKEITRPRRYDIKEIALIATSLGLVSTVFDFIFFALFYRLGPSVLQTNWFIASILTELVFLFSIRTRFVFFKAKRASLPILLLTGAAMAATLIIPFTRMGQTTFKFMRPDPGFLLLILGLVVAYFVITEIVKFYYYRHFGTHQKHTNTL